MLAIRAIAMGTEGLRRVVCFDGGFLPGGFGLDIYVLYTYIVPKSDIIRAVVDWTSDIVSVILSSILPHFIILFFVSLTLQR